MLPFPITLISTRRTRYLDVVRGIGIEPDSEEPEMFVNGAAQQMGG